MRAKTVVCVLLVASVASLPPDSARAGVIPTDAVVNPAVHAQREALRALISRPEVVSELQGFGIEARLARERVDALSDDEAALVAAQIGALPAGGQMAPGGGGEGGGGGLGLLLIVVLLFALVLWWVSRQSASK